MSIYSGKCDLADHISGLGGWFDKDGNPVSFGQEGVGVFYSDEMLDFEAFKEQTGGVLHQHKKVKVNEWNQEEVAKHCDRFEIIPHIQIIEDKRYKEGKREVTTYTYKYWDKEYTLKELNKHGVWVTVDIHFNTLLDLIPYYPYIVSVSCHKDGKQTVFISNESYVTEKRDSAIEHGFFSNYWETYTKELQNHYKEIVLNYFNPKGYEKLETVIFQYENGKYLGKVKYPIDYNFDVEWRWKDGKTHNHWSSPKVVDYEQGIIEMSTADFNKYIGDTIDVYYVTTREREINVR